MILFPNPTKDKMSVDAMEEVVIRIYDPCGTLIIEKKLNGELCETVDLSKIEPGLYTATLESKTEVDVKRLFIE